MGIVPQERNRKTRILELSEEALALENFHLRARVIDLEADNALLRQMVEDFIRASESRP